MASPERVEQTLKATLFRVILDPNHLGMVRRAGANILVRRVVNMPLGIPYLGLGNARHALKRELDAPETTRPELGEQLTRSRGIVIWALCDCGVHGAFGRARGAEAELIEPAHPWGGDKRGGSRDGRRGSEGERFPARK